MGRNDFLFERRIFRQKGQVELCYFIFLLEKKALNSKSVLLKSYWKKQKEQSFTNQSDYFYESIKSAHSTMIGLTSQSGLTFQFIGVSIDVNDTMMEEEEDASQFYLKQLRL